MLNTRPLHKSVHYDAFYKYLRLKFGRSTTSIFDLFPQAKKWTQGQAVAISQLTLNYMAYFPIEIWNQQVWRGRKILSKNRLSRKSSTSFLSKVEIIKVASWRHFQVDSLVYHLLGDRAGSAFLNIKGIVMTHIGKTATFVIRILRRHWTSVIKYQTIKRRCDSSKKGWRLDQWQACWSWTMAKNQYS